MPPVKGQGRLVFGGTNLYIDNTLDALTVFLFLTVDEFCQQALQDFF
jgi:hypothetical protein